MLKPNVQLLQIFDTTGSMTPCIRQVRDNGRRLIEQCGKSLPNLEMGALAHGDLCDHRSTYVTKTHPLTRDLNALMRFIRDVGPSGGGDAAECYELALRVAGNMNWDPSAKKAIVMFGDEVPHEPSYYQNLGRFGITHPRELGIPASGGIRWQDEAQRLREMGITVYPVQCLNNSHATPFRNELAEITGGVTLQLHQFSNVLSLILGIAHREAGEEEFERYEQEIRGTVTVTYELDDILDLLAGRRVKARTTKREDELVPVDPSRFQPFQLSSNERFSLKEFGIENNISRMFKDGEVGGKLKTGLIFHCVDATCVDKAELLEKHHVVLHDLRTGEWFTGPAARNLLDCPYGKTTRLSPNPLPGFEVWKQSTSPNWVLEPGTRVLVDYKPELGFN